jgi:hypothetical protein
MADIFFGDFRVVVINHIKEINTDNPGAQSPEWFLLKYLNRIVKNTELPSSAGKIEGSMRALIRFYLDNIEEKSNLGNRCLHVYEEYRKAVKQHQETGH